MGSLGWGGVAVARLRRRWRRGGAGCVALRFVLFFDEWVVDVPGVQVVDVGSSSSWTRW